MFDRILRKMRELVTQDAEWLMILCLRLASILHRRRDVGQVPLPALFLTGMALAVVAVARPVERTAYYAAKRVLDFSVALVALIGLLGACSDGKPSGDAPPGPYPYDTYLTVIRDVDVLFVIDNSGSMADEQDMLRAQFPALVLKLVGAVVPEGQDQIRLTLAMAPLLSADPIRLRLEGRALIDGKEVVHPAAPAEEMTQAFFYKHAVPAGDLILVPEDRTRFREEAARAAQENKPFPPPAAQRSFQPPLEILSEQPVRIPVGGTVEVQVRLGWSRNGQIQVELSDPPEGITVDSASWTERGLALVLRGDAAKAQPPLKGNLMANAFLQTTVTEKDGKTRDVRNFIGPLPALPFEVVKP